MFKNTGSRRPHLSSVGNSSSSPGLHMANPTSPFPINITKSRTSHACDRCRTMRTKCTGGTRCTKCIKDDAVCQYGDRKRERNKKDLAESVDRISELQDDNRNLLSALQTLIREPGFNAQQHSEIVDYVNSYANTERSTSPQSSHTQSQSQSQSLRSPTYASEGEGSASRANRTQERGGEDRIASSIGSPGRLGELPVVVDLDHGMGASGFVGKISEMSWMQRAREYLIKRPKSSGDIVRATLDEHAQAAQTLTYYMDDTNLLSIDEDHVDPLEWPPYHVALILSEAYFHATRGVFHFILREQFLDMLAKTAAQSAHPSWRERRWLAVANIVWAIGAKWLYLVKLDHNFPDSHLVYYARARALGLDHRIHFDHPDVEMVEGIGLLSFYLLVNGSISRAWNILGNAVRHATALGLHLRITDETIDAAERERRARTWFSLYNLEISIVETTGRPQSIQTNQITIPLEIISDVSYHPDRHGPTTDVHAMSKDMWLKFLASSTDTDDDEESSVSWSQLATSTLPPAYLKHHVQLCRVSDTIGAKLYTGSAETAWSETQDLIREMEALITDWANGLPEELKVDNSTNKMIDPHAQIELAMYYQSLKMILHRPCLCEIRIEGESTTSRLFNQESARACVHAAMSLLNLIPDNPVAYEVRKLLPWWSLLHYICQAGAVLLLELCLDCQHFQGEAQNVIGAVRKTMSYLWCMSEESMSAYRAWRIFKGLSSEVSGRYGGQRVFNIRENAPVPSGWTENAEKSVNAVFAR